MKISHLASEPRFENKSKTLRYVKVPLKLLYRINGTFWSDSGGFVRAQLPPRLARWFGLNDDLNAPERAE